MLGAYDQIASYRGGRGGRAKSFTIGVQAPIAGRLRKESPHPLPEAITITATFIRKESQPRLREWLLDADPLRVAVEYGEEGNFPMIRLSAPSGVAEVRLAPSLLRTGLRLSMILSYVRFALSAESHGTEKGGVTGGVSTPDLELLNALTRDVIEPLGQRPYAFAPIRTRPLRTYDPIKDVPMPEGSHVPMILAKTLSSDKKGSEEFRRVLDAFGKSSGLFSDVEVRRMGRTESDPFQVRVKISGPAFNLLDVGYGVSQILPIIVDSVRRPRASTFLLQQPEIHLHPRAQAALGSFLGVLAKQGRKQFIIETHSDYLVDRIRMDVRDGEELTPDDVLILYFERDNGNVRIQPLRIDHFGNIIDAPLGYRQFFLEEERRLLGG